MYNYRNNLNPDLLKDIHRLEDRYPVIIMLQYIYNDVVATFVDRRNLDFANEIKIGTRDTTKEQLAINMRKELERIYPDC